MVATAASLLIGRPVKWVEDRTGNLISTGFARDYHMRGELAVKDGKMTGLRASLLSDQGAFFADAQPTKVKAGLFHIVTGSYDIPAAHVVTDGYYTNKAPGGVAYRCSFRVTEASYLIERLVDNAAHELGVDAAQFRLTTSFSRTSSRTSRRRAFSTTRATTPEAMRIALEKLGYEQLRAEQEAARAEGRLLGIGLASFTESSAPARGRTTTSPACACSTRRSSASIPRARRSSSSASARRGRARDDLRPDRGQRARHPVRPHRGAGGRYRQHPLRARHVREPLDPRRRGGDGGDRPQASGQGQGDRRPPARGLGDDIEFEEGRFFVKGSPDRAKTIQDIAFAAYSDIPDGMEAGLEGVHYYDRRT